MNEMLTLEELKLLLVEMLGDFDKICRENNIRYVVAYGTALGAVRHGGFIPWDDDIDVLVPRADYERLMALNFENDSYKIMNYRNQKDYYYPFAKLVNKKTRLIEYLRTEKNMGVYIDIFPCDFISADPKDFPQLVKKAEKYHWLWFRIGMSLKYDRAFSVSYFKKILFKAGVFPFKKLIIKYCDCALKSEKGKYCVCFSDALSLGEFFMSNVWDEITYISFEGIKVPIFKNYDYYLTSLYGDYMMLPPEEQRISNHNYNAFLK